MKGKSSTNNVEFLKTNAFYVLNKEEENRVLNYFVQESKALSPNLCTYFFLIFDNRVGSSFVRNS